MRRLRFRPAPVVVLADHDDLAQILKALESGARGYIPSSVGIEICAEAIFLALAGGTLCSGKQCRGHEIRYRPAHRIRITRGLTKPSVPFRPHHRSLQLTIKKRTEPRPARSDTLEVNNFFPDQLRKPRGSSSIGKRSLIL
jgi:DNA-binding NarL/FixJ family response regulator